MTPVWIQTPPLHQPHLLHPASVHGVYGCYRNTSPDVTLTDKYMEALSVFTAVVVV